MEESRALSKLSDATDLLILLEDILNPASIERLSQASWSGLRITLRNARITLQESQNALSKEFVARARSAGQAQAVASPVSQADLVSAAAGVSAEDIARNSAEQSKAIISRRDLKATLEKFIENRG